MSSLFRSSALEIWKNHRLFESVPIDSLERLLLGMQEASHEAGVEIITQGGTGRDMLLLCEGSVQVSVRSPDHSEIVKRKLEAPAIIGEMALVTREPRAATVTTITRISCLSLSPVHFITLITEHPEVANFLTELVGEKLKEGAGIRKVGKYRILRQLGSGSVATVFEAEHPELGNTVALKMLSHALVAHAGFSGHFAREGRTVALLEHPNIVRVLDTERAYGTLFIVMERLHGTVLSELIEGNVSLPARKVRIILMDCCRALAHTHNADWIHRDIKPSNLFMTQDGVAKLLDFGIAVRMNETESGSERVGTPYYMSPEQIRGQELDGRADLYSLGIMAFQLLTGQKPFRASTLPKLLKKHLHTPFPNHELQGKGYPEDLVRFVEVATRKNRAHRHASCTEALAELTSGRELPFVHTLLLASILIQGPQEAEEKLAKSLRALRSLLNIHGMRFTESVSENSGGKSWYFSVVAHPSHKRRLTGTIEAMKGRIRAEDLSVNIEVEWALEDEEEPALELPKGILSGI